jgi:hypothetical protein
MQNSMSRVECLRQMMHITAFNKGISHPDVLVISRRLDEAINGLYKVDQQLSSSALTDSPRNLRRCRV